MIPAPRPILRLLLPALGLLLGLTLPDWAQALSREPVPDREAVRRMVVDEAANSLVPPEMALALAKVQSDFQPIALGSAGGRGVMQIMPETARTELGIDIDELWDPRLNIQIGLDRLGRLYERHQSWERALAAFHGGEAVDAAAPGPDTRRFVEAVLRWWHRYAAQGALWAELDARSRDSFAERAATSRDEPLALAGRTLTGADGRPTFVIWRQGRLAADDDFRGIEARRQAARLWLDDFASVPFGGRGR